MSVSTAMTFSFPKGINPVLLMTGGIESTTLLVWLKKEYGEALSVIIFDMKHLPWQAELAVQFCNEEKVKCYVVPVDWAPGEYNAREALLVAEAAGIIPPFNNAVWFSGLSQNRFNELYSGPIRPAAPFRYLFKEEVIQLLSRDLGRDDLLQRTHSCQQQSTHCGKCAQCYDRKYGFYQAGVEDRTTYAIPTEEVLAGALQRLKEIAYDRTGTETTHLL